MRGSFLFSLLMVLSYSYPSSALIFGNDSRVLLSRKEVESRRLKPVVYLFVKKRNSVYSCTGSWVSEKHVLTARHCVAGAEKILIYNQFENYTSPLKTKATAIYIDSDPNLQRYDKSPRPNGGDWAVIEAEKPDGDLMGSFQMKSTEALNQNFSLKVGAFHSDADEGLRLQYCGYQPRNLYQSYRLMYRTGLFEFDCDMMAGASGAPILNCEGVVCSIVGIYSGEFFPPDGQGGDDGHLQNFSHVYSNVAVKSDNFIRQVRSIIRTGVSANVKKVDLKTPDCDSIRCLDTQI